MNFGDPRLLNDERAEMLLGVDAGDAPATSGPTINSSRQPLSTTISGGINQNELVGRQSFLAAAFRIVLQNKVRQSGEWESPISGASQ